MNTAMQVKSCENAEKGDAASIRRLLQRQARVGIIANTAEVSLPVPPPKDVWLRWPRLHSSRRLRRGANQSQNTALAQDRVLSGNLLHDFINDMRGAMCTKDQDSGHVQRLHSAASVEVQAAKADAYEDRSSAQAAFLDGVAAAARGVTSFWQRMK